MIHCLRLGAELNSYRRFSQVKQDEAEEDMEEGEVLEEGEISDEETPAPAPAVTKEPTPTREPSKPEQKSPVATKEEPKAPEGKGKDDIEEFMKKKKQEFDQKVRNQSALAGGNAGTEKKDSPPSKKPTPLLEKPISPPMMFRKEKGKRRDLDAAKPSLLGPGPDPTETMINSWMKGGKKHSPEHDPNDEFYFGTTAASPPPGQVGDKDFRAETASLGDTDYRNWRGDEDGSASGYSADKSSSNEFGDRDYRGSKGSSIRRSPNPRRERDTDRRRKRSDSPEGDDGRRSREERRKRIRKTPSPPSRDSGPPPRGRGGSRWHRPTICRFFRDGFCRDGDSCLFSHDASDSQRRPELCKYYQQGYCKKSAVCPFLHGEYPCKAFHKGECSKGEECPYSHTPLNDFTRPIFDQMIRDEELASKITIPPVPTKRKTLLPAPTFTNGPAGPPGPGGMGGMNMNQGMGMNQGMNMNQGMPPMNQGMQGNNGPGPMMNQMGPPQGQNGDFNQGPQGPDMGPNNSGMPYGQLGPPPIPPPFAPPVGMVFPGAPLYTPPNQNQPMANQNNGGPANDGPIQMSGAPSSPPKPPKIEIKEDKNQSTDSEVQSPKFDINQMLQKIKSKTQVDTPDEPEESPASPPPQMPASSSLPQTIPSYGIPVYRLVICDAPNIPNSVSPDLISASIKDPKLRNDPRIKKQLDSQFNAGSNIIATSSSKGKDGEKPGRADPRMSSRDPRLARQQAQSSPQQSSNSAASQSANPSLTPFQDPLLMDHQQKIEMQLKMVNQGPGMSMPGPMMPPMPPVPPDMAMPSIPQMFGIAPTPPNMGGSANPMLGGSPSSWMPNVNDANGGLSGSPPDQDERINPGDPRQRRDNRSRWNRNFPTKGSPNPIADSDDRPLSMREKRKDNIYESPLSSGSARQDSIGSRYNEMPGVKVRRKEMD